MIIIKPCFQAGTNNPSPRQKRPFHSSSERTGQSPNFLNFPPDWCNANKNIRALGGMTDWKREEKCLWEMVSQWGFCDVTIWEFLWRDHWMGSLQPNLGKMLALPCVSQDWECGSPQGKDWDAQLLPTSCLMDLKLPRKHSWGSHPALSAPSCHGTWERLIFTTWFKQALLTN